MLCLSENAATTFDRFQVDVAALVQAEDNFGLPEIHRSARMIWNEVDARSPRLEIYVQTKMLRQEVAAPRLTAYQPRLATTPDAFIQP